MNKKYSTHFILNDDHSITEVPDLMEWAKWMESGGREKRRVGYDEANGLYVSTVFLGLDYSFSMRDDAQPVLFETMVFNLESQYDESIKRNYHASIDDDGFFNRYCTYEEALAGHKEILENVKNGIFWRCDMCGRTRIDSEIAVYTYPLKDLPGGERNVKYCKGDQECLDKAIEKGMSGTV